MPSMLGFFSKLLHFLIKFNSSHEFFKYCDQRLRGKCVNIFLGSKALPLSCIARDPRFCSFIFFFQNFFQELIIGFADIAVRSEPDIVFGMSFDLIAIPCGKSINSSVISHLFNSSFVFFSLRTLSLQHKTAHRAGHPTGGKSGTRTRCLSAFTIFCCSKRLCDNAGSTKRNVPADSLRLDRCRNALS